ncbi:MAG: glycosyltransferase family 2 protein [Fimbriimonadaceae bacterium]|nr:glycosyltransferase family 2 protein [Fimbriimonadaceae bacterium]
MAPAADRGTRRAAAYWGGMAGVTLLVLTRDEAPRLGRCLASCRELADEILVIDSGSTDGTVEVAEAAGARVEVRAWPGRAAQSNYAASRVNTEWFFHLDADEVSTPALNRAVRRSIDLNLPGIVGYRVTRREVFLGREVRCGMHRNLLRLCRTGQCAMPAQRAHARWDTGGETRPLLPALWHHADQPLDEQLAKWIHRGRLSALDYHDRGEPATYGRLLWHPLATLLRLYVLKGGFLDGVPGLLLCGTRTAYCFSRMMHLWELQQRGSQ